MRENLTWTTVTPSASLMIEQNHTLPNFNKIVENFFKQNFEGLMFKKYIF